MTPRTCPRCRAALHSEDANSLVFCWSCGAPQVYLSEELQEQFAQQQMAPQPGDAAAPPIEPVTDPTAVVWSRAIQLAGLAGAAALALSLVTAVFPDAALLVLLWAAAAPIILMGIYCARTPRTRITTGFGARLGLLTGLSITLSTTFMSAVSMLLSRFAFHRGEELDSFIDKMFASAGGTSVMPSSSDVAAASKQLADAWSRLPDYRVGAILASFLMFFVLYLVYATLAGAFAGLLRSSTKAR